MNLWLDTKEKFIVINGVLVTPPLCLDDDGRWVPYDEDKGDAPDEPCSLVTPVALQASLPQREFIDMPFDPVCFPYRPHEWATLPI